MKAMLILALWTCSAVAATYMVAAPDGGIAYRHPMAAIGVGLFGLGLCQHARKAAPKARG